jgi:lipid A 3-O-deacylase
MRRHFLLCFCLLVSIPCGAQENSPATRTFFVENDVFVGTDRQYTNGLRYAVMRNATEAPWWGRLLAREFGICGDPDKGNDAQQCFRIARGTALTHTFYTPVDLSVAAPIPDDRPYGGWLHFTSMFDLSNEAGHHHHFEASLGVLGEWSLAEDIQREWHEIIESSPPLGWDNQIGNEVSFLLLYRWRKSLIEKFTDPDETIRAFDLKPHVVGAFGNVFTYGGAGVTARLGYNLSDDFPGVIQPVAALPPTSGPPWEAYVFVLAEGRAVADNVFLDGNSRHGPSVDKEPLVTDFGAGIAVGYKRLLLTYSAIRRSREFTRQPEPQDFGSFTITWRPAL